mgnify:CR=1 FL=1
MTDMYSDAFNRLAVLYKTTGQANIKNASQIQGNILE